MPAEPNDSTLLRPGADDALRPTPTGAAPLDGFAVDPFVLPRNEAERFSTVEAGRFRVIEKHAQGGLGDVYRAADGELNREVALKRLRTPHARNAQTRARFLQEAELTAELEHPGVVPVHGLVEDADGHPCYAMRFVEGQNLAQAIQQFHRRLKEAPQPAALFRGVEFRQLLQRFVALCNTIAFAHSRGILHRDLKPANVMVGPFGETLVVDWGLAKRLSAGPELPEEMKEADAAATLPLPLSTRHSTQDQLTQAGQLLGTPAYMSPEQVDGVRLTTATDGYGLGAILYELLTGQAPAPGTDVRAVLLKVREGLVAAPRSVQPAAPRGLEAICLKALRTKPEERYASAQALAADVERWLADEPLEAAPEGAAARARRWLRRHRTLAALAAALLLAAVALLGATALILGEKNGELEAANSREKAATKRAEAAAAKSRRDFDRVQEAISQLLLSAESGLIVLPGTEPAREALLDEALALETKLLAERRGEPEAQFMLGRLHHRVAMMRSSVGRLGETEKHLRLALELLAAAAAGLPEAPDVWLALGNAHLLEFVHSDRAGKTEAADQALRRSVDALRTAVALDPERAEARRELAKALAKWSRWCSERGRHAEGDAAEAEAVQALEPRLAAADVGDEDLRTRAMLSHFAALRLGQRGEQDGAERGFRAALEQYRAVSPAHRANRWWLEHYAGCLSDYSSVVRERADAALAVSLLTEAIQTQNRLTADQPRDLTYRSQLTNLHLRRAEACRALSRGAEAAEDEARARELHAALGAEAAPSRQARFRAANFLDADAKLLSQRKQHAAAVAKADEAIRRLKELAEADPQDVEVQVRLAGVICNRGTWLREGGRHEEAEAAYRDAQARLEALLRLNPEPPSAREYLSVCWSGLALSFDTRKRPAEAATAWGQAFAVTNRGYPFYLCSRLDSLIAAGDRDTAVKELEAYAVPDGLQGGWCLDFAQVTAQLAAAGPEEERARLRVRALKLLDRARQGGSFKLPERRAMLDRPVYVVLHGEPAWKALLDRIQTEGQTPKP